MSTRTILGGFWLVVALWALAAFTSDAESPLIPAIVPADCGPKPSWSASRDQWFAYGDCQGDYGPIDAAELPSESHAERE